MNVAQLERDRAAKLREGQALFTKYAKDANGNDRLMSEEELAEIDAISKEGQEIDAKLDRARRGEDMRSALDTLTGRPTGSPPPVVPIRKSLGTQWTSDPEIHDFFFKQHAHRTSSTWRSPSKELAVDWTRGLYAELMTSDVASAGQLIIPQFLPGILPLLQARLMIADLFSQGTTDSNALVYMVESVWTNNAAPVLEAGVKPESVLKFESVTEAVRKIAHWIPVTEELLEDVPAIRSFIDARLRLGVMQTEEDQLLNGNGTAPNLNGLLNRPGLAPNIPRDAAESNADVIFRQMMAIYATSFLMPDAVVMNPADWADTLLTKTKTGEYFTAGPFAPIQSAQLWGVRVAVTPAEPAGTAIVGAFREGAQLFRRGGIRVEASNSHQDFFIKNLVAIRAEERLVLCVYRPQAFGRATNLGKPTVTP